MAEEAKRFARDASGRFAPKSEASENAEEPSGESHGPDEVWVEDISDTVAPSIGPHSVVTHRPVQHRTGIDIDAMGKEKRRAVVGHSYGPSKARQATLYGIFLAVVFVILFGGKLLVDAADTPVGKNVPNSAPWAQPKAPQQPPKPLQ